MINKELRKPMKKHWYNCLWSIQNLRMARKIQTISREVCQESSIFWLLLFWQLFQYFLQTTIQTFTEKYSKFKNRLSNLNFCSPRVENKLYFSYIFIRSIFPTYSCVVFFLPVKERKIMRTISLPIKQRRMCSKIGQNNREGLTKKSTSVEKAQAC